MKTEFLTKLDTSKVTKVRVRYARVSVGSIGITSRYIRLDPGVGPASFRKLCNHPQHWFKDVDGRHLRATAISAFIIIDEAEYRRIR